jgi:hypothetical protein
MAPVISVTPGKACPNGGWLYGPIDREIHELSVADHS